MGYAENGMGLQHRIYAMGIMTYNCIYAKRASAWQILACLLIQYER